MNKEAVLNYKGLVGNPSPAHNAEITVLTEFRNVKEKNKRT